MSTGKHLYIITMEYPYGKGEAFMEDELEELANIYDRVFLFPYLKCDPTTKRTVPGSNIETIDIFQIEENGIPNSVLVKNLGKVIQMLKIDGTKKMREKLVLFKNCLFKAQLLNDFIKNDGKEKHFYSMWMSTPSTVLSILKSQGKIEAFVSRAHGYDIVKERRTDQYIALLTYNISKVSHVFLNSNYSLESIKEGLDSKGKFSVSYIGIKDRLKSSLGDITNEDSLKIVSVSNLYEFKRVDKIFKVLELVSKHIKVFWTHFGDGPEMEELKKTTSVNSSTLKIDFKGHVERDKIYDFYLNQKIDLFIHLSEIEGFGVAIAEAQCFGIPVLVARTGGTPETFSNKSGIGVETDTSIEDIANIILNEKKSGNLVERRSYARKLFLSKFDAKIVTRLFHEEMNQFFP